MMIVKKNQTKKAGTYSFKDQQIIKKAKVMYPK
jgi:hypothetical protein